jgi:hypothetical protein
VLGEVVAHEHVEQVAETAQVRVSEDDQLAFAAGGGQRGGAVEMEVVPGEKGGRDQDRRGVGGRGQVEDFVGRAGVAADEAVEEGGLVNGHRRTVSPGADGTLTAD